MLPVRSSKERHVHTLPGPLPVQGAKFHGIWFQRFTGLVLPHMSLLIIVASGHERPGVTSNRVFIEGYWCLK